MATVCGGSIALMDAGVPIEPVVGISIGLVSADPECSDYRLLTDIIGMEDHLGDMDFKLAGTRKGITALQADIKLPGLPFEVVKEAMWKGHTGINNILDIMHECIEEPRNDKSNLPLTDSLTIPVTKRGKFIGPGGNNLKKILTETGVQISTSSEDISKFNLFAPNNVAMQEAREIIKQLLESDTRLPEFKFGEVYQVEITEILDRGIFVQMHPEMKPAFINNSQLEARKVSDARVLGFKIGESIHVKYYGNDPVSGDIRLSRKVLKLSAASTMGTLRKSIIKPTDSTPSEH